MKTGSIGRNEPCPCGSGAKFKSCCQPKGVPLAPLLFQRAQNAVRRQNARARNIAFLESAAAALQLDGLAIRDWGVVKRACTPAAVRRIHEATMFLWPDEDDYFSILSQERGKESGVYIGEYEPDLIMQGITRHTVYSDTIIVFDPFLDARAIAPYFNPLIHPEKFRSATLKNLYLWLSLAPWIDANLVTILPCPTNFDPTFALEVMNQQRAKLRRTPELAASIDNSKDQLDSLATSYTTFMILHTADEALEKRFRELNPESSDEAVAEFMSEVKALRESHPYYIPNSLGNGPDAGEFTFTTTGASFPVAKMVAGVAEAHLITDVEAKWLEIELDRRQANSTNDRWTPFAKAFQGVTFPYLNEVPLHAALELRKHDRLSDMRGFLRKVWKASRSTDEFSASNASDLTEELRSRIAEAEREWNNIDRDLAKYVGGGAVVSAGLGAATGHFLAALPFLFSAVTQLMSARSERRDFIKCHPAAFFMQLKRQCRRQ